MIDYKPWEEYREIWATEAEFWEYLGNELLDCVWKTWPLKSRWLESNKVPAGYTVSPKTLPTLGCWEDVPLFVKSLCCGVDGMEILATPDKAEIEDKRLYYVYWIKLAEHTDIYNEGYVGITLNPEVRILQHINNAKNHTTHKYGKNFRKTLLSGGYDFVIVDRGSLDFCKQRERELRSLPYIGWNRAIGGDGGVIYKHGLTGSKTAKTYYNLLSRAKSEQGEFYSEWLGVNGLQNFSEFYDKWQETEGEFSLIEKGSGYYPNNLVKMSRSQIIKRAYRRHAIGDGLLYSVSELGEKFNIKPNTISVRIRDGWTVREAVGLDQRISRRKTSVED